MQFSATRSEFDCDLENVSKTTEGSKFIAKFPALQILCDFLPAWAKLDSDAEKYSATIGYGEVPYEYFLRFNIVDQLERR